jgi:hypothetical protein
MSHIHSSSDHGCGFSSPFCSSTTLQTTRSPHTAMSPSNIRETAAGKDEKQAIRAAIAATHSAAAASIAASASLRFLYSSSRIRRCSCM